MFKCVCIRRQIVGAIGSVFLLCGNSIYGSDLVSKTNTLIGTQGNGWASGYVYPGATYPFGMVQFTPTYFTKQLGFVINQLSGAGCDHMGNFPTLPLAGPLTISPDSILNLRTSISQENGTAGSYTATVNHSIRAELTVTERTGMARYTFAPEQQQGTVIIGAGVAATPIQVAAVKITGPHSCEGYAEGGTFCGIPTPYKIYFAAEFDADAEIFGTWQNRRLYAGHTFAEGSHSGVYFTFPLKKEKKTVQYKIGVSYVSVENARENLKTENPAWDFETVRRTTEDKWNRMLGKIEITGENADRQTQFYTHLYHSLIHPNVCSDVNGEYRGPDNQVHRTARKFYTSFSNWDTYRTQTPLIALLAPEETSDIVMSHYLFAEQSGGGFPRWVLANIETGVMQGDPTPIVVANAYAFGARNYDARSLLRVMRYGAENPDAHSGGIPTRPGSEQYQQKGYYDASILLEYTSSDFAIGRFALQACNDEPVCNGYTHRSMNWKNLFNKETKWLQSRNPDGSWRSYDADWRESTYKNYFWMVPYDLQSLIDSIGGKKAAEQRLDDLFRRLDASYGDEWFASGNEPSFQIPWIYNWAGAPYKAQAVIRRILNEQYNSRKDGLPGNDDLGSMGAWYVFASIGLYPEIPGVGGFAVNSPVFSKIILHLADGDVIITGGDEKKPYIRSMRLNGREVGSSWIDWDDLSQGATIEYRLSSTPDPQWGTQVAPPSFGK